MEQNSSLDTDEDKVPFPSPVAIHDALAQYCDLTAFPKRGTVAALARRPSKRVRTLQKHLL